MNETVLTPAALEPKNPEAHLQEAYTDSHSRLKKEAEDHILM